MKLLSLIAVAAILQGCAPMPNMPPPSPEQAAYIRQMQLEQQRAYNERILESQRAMTRRQPTYSPTELAPQPSGYVAVWTGRSLIAQSATGISGFNCEYTYAGRNFWRMFASSCPSSILIQ